MRVLVLVEGRLVETLQASPLVRTLANGIGGVEVTLACSPMAAEVARALEGVDHVIPLRGLDPDGTPLDWVSAWAAVRRRRFDVAVICGTRAGVRLLAYLAGLPRRVGQSGGPTAVLLSDRVTAPATENRAATWLRLAGRLGVTRRRSLPRLDPGTEADRQAMEWLSAGEIADGRLLVAMAPGTRHSDIWGIAPEMTGWPPERWAHLANQLASRHGAGIVILGAQADSPEVGDTVEDVDAAYADLTGLPDGLLIAAILHRCDLVVSGDSPILHLAAAVGTPTVGLFGPTDGRRRGPYGEESRVVQAVPRGRKADPAALMEQIRVEDVLAGIEAAL
jgi:heptosyltransferase-2